MLRLQEFSNGIDAEDLTEDLSITDPEIARLEADQARLEADQDRADVIERLVESFRVLIDSGMTGDELETTYKVQFFNLRKYLLVSVLRDYVTNDEKNLMASLALNILLQRTTFQKACNQIDIFHREGKEFVPSGGELEN